MTPPMPCTTTSPLVAVRFDAHAELRQRIEHPIDVVGVEQPAHDACRRPRAPRAAACDWRCSSTPAARRCPRRAPPARGRDSRGRRRGRLPGVIGAVRALRLARPVDRGRQPARHGCRAFPLAPRAARARANTASSAAPSPRRPSPRRDRAARDTRRSRRAARRGWRARCRATSRASSRRCA